MLVWVKHNRIESWDMEISSVSIYEGKLRIFYNQLKTLWNKL